MLPCPTTYSWEYSERSEYFDIGANSYGYAVFKEPNTAFAVFVELYSDGIEL